MRKLLTARGRGRTIGIPCALSLAIAVFVPLLGPAIARGSDIATTLRQMVTPPADEQRSYSSLLPYGTDGSIDGLNPIGKVLFSNNGQRYLSRPGLDVVHVGSSLGHAWWQGEHWLVAIGRSLFQVPP